VNSKHQKVQGFAGDGDVVVMCDLMNVDPIFHLRVAFEGRHLLAIAILVSTHAATKSLRQAKVRRHIPSKIPQKIIF
tara:strand:+ start:609 stop:839 length:231 start_codon:yes stop_codon:yes gene_type:complete